MATSQNHDDCGQQYVSATSILGNLPELIAYWRSLREKHFVIISLPDRRYVQLLVTKDAEVVCEVIADEFLDFDLKWNLRQRTQLREHFTEPTGEPKTSCNWLYYSEAPEATMEASMKAAFALYKVMRVRPDTQVLVDMH